MNSNYNYKRNNREQFILRTQYETLNRIQTKNNTDRLNYLSKCKVIKKFNSKNIYSKGAFLLDNYIVGKSLYPNMSGYIFWKNEINALKKVIGIPYFPQLIAADPTNLIIYMTYCGNNLEEGNSRIPENWKSQLNQIKKILINKHLNPNDILPRNICIFNKRIKIIDFGLSNTRYNEIMRSINRLHKILSSYSN